MVRFILSSARVSCGRSLRMFSAGRTGGSGVGRPQSFAAMVTAIVVSTGVAACSAAKPSARLTDPAEFSPAPGKASCGLVARPDDGPIRSAYAPGEVTCLCRSAIETARARFDAISRVPAQRRNFENTTLEYELTNSDFSDSTNALYFMTEVSPDQATHDEALKCVDELQAFGIEIGARRDLYEAVKAGAPIRTGDADGAFAERLRLYQELVRGFERGGLKLPDAELAQLTALQRTLADLQTEYASNLTQDHPVIVLGADDVEGLSQAFLDRVRAADGTFAIEVNEPNYTEIAQKAKKGEVRRRFLVAFNNLGGERNVELLNQAVATRAKIARLLGYATYADYAAEPNMAKDAAKIDAFLENLRAKLQPRVSEENRDLLAYKRRLDPAATELFPWDVAYLTYQIKKNDLRVDDDLVREYFPAETVIAGLFEVYSTILGVRFEEVKGITAWAPDVKLYAIREADAAADSEPIGFFYADLAPRRLKYTHAAAFSLIQGRMLPDGAYNKPVSSIVANLTPPGAGRPSLLSHGEVETLFHEFGHIMHQTLTRAPYASLSGSGVARDFVEAPSQMLENWVWRPEILRKISGHWQDSSRKLPAELLEQLLRARDFGRGTFYAKQSLYARWDMAMHSVREDEAVDAQGLYDRMYEETVGLKPPQGAHLAGNFGHMMGGYAAGYYGYLWSDVYASDMFTQFERGGVLDPGVGARYRKLILERGNMADGGDLLRGFLGREPSDEAFLRKLGLAQSP